MSSSSEKGKSGGKKLSADKQLLALQDALTSGVKIVENFGKGGGGKGGQGL